MNKKVAIILPQREGFSPQRFGAVSLSVRDFMLHSKFREECAVIGGTDEPSFPNIPYTAVTQKKKWYQNRTFHYARQCQDFFKTYQPDLIETHNRPLFTRYMLALTNTPIALHFHNDPQEMKCCKTTRGRTSLLRKLAAVYCVSHYVRERYLEGVPEALHHKVHVPYCGIDIKRPTVEKQKEILFVGRMTENKGGLLFAQALEKALPSLKGWKGVMIGGRRHASSAEYSEYEQHILEVCERVGSALEFRGFCNHEETMQAFADASIAAIPSLWPEPFGRTALEAMALGAVVISSGSGGLREVTENSAIIVEDMSVDSLAEAITSLANDEEQQLSLRAQGYEQADSFHISNKSATLDAIRDNIMEQA
jgi:glycosyltransferase involved in cell wall biosynthesis